MTPDANRYRGAKCVAVRLGSLPALILTIAALGNGQPAAPQVEIINTAARTPVTAQVKVLLPSPESSPTGAIRLTVARGGERGLALFLAGGDIFGAAVRDGDRIDVSYVVQSGRDANRPLLIVDPDTSDGIQTGGSLSIRNVVPGGGILPAGAVVTLQGGGFRPDTRVQLAGPPDPLLRYISPSEIQLTLPLAARIDGLEITARNPDDSSSRYISHWRGTPAGESAEPLIARTIPLFTQRTTRSAVLPPAAITRVEPDYILALALQNPGLVPAEITVASGPGTGARILLPPGGRFSREIGELLGTTSSAQGAVTVNSSEPIQVLGLLGNRRAGTVTPLALTVD